MKFLKTGIIIPVLIVAALLAVIAAALFLMREKQPPVIARVQIAPDFTLDLVSIVHPKNPSFKVVPWQSKIVERLPVKLQVWLTNAGVPRTWTFEPFPDPNTLWFHFYARSENIRSGTVYVGEFAMVMKSGLQEENMSMIRIDLGNGRYSSIGSLEEKAIMAGAIGAKDFIPFQVRLDDVITSETHLNIQFVTDDAINTKVIRSITIPNPLL